MLLAHHGLLAAGRSVQEATFLAVFIERMARLQLDAARVGGVKPIDAGEARRARDFLRTDRIMNATFDAWSRRAERRRRARVRTRWTGRLETALGAVSAAVLFVMMLVTAIDVAGRYVLSLPLPGGLEMTEMMLAALIYCGLPIVSLHRGHIVIDTLDPFFPRPFKRALDVLADSVCFVTLAGIGWLIFRRALARRRVRRHDGGAEAAARAGGLPDGRDDRRRRADPPAPDLRAACRRRRSRPDLEGADMSEAFAALAAMLVLSFLRVPIAFSMGLVGFLGVWWMRGLNVSMASATTVVYESGFQYTLSVVPLFILMGNFVTRAGMSKELYRAAHTFVGHLRGGLAMATVIACGGFGAICGSSIATSATMTHVAYPSMRDHGYSDDLAAGSIAAGGTLGILIPPSTIMVIYGIITDTSIGKLFAAGILPGLVAIVLLCVAVQYITWRNPAAGPRAERAAWDERLAALKDVWAVALALRHRHGRHLRRRLHGHRGRRHRRVRRLRLRLGTPRALAARAVRGAGRERANDGDAVHDPGRRARLHQLPQLHDDARRT